MLGYFPRLSLGLFVISLKRINASISGELIDGDTEYKGKIEIPNLSEENDADEIDVSFGSPIK